MQFHAAIVAGQTVYVGELQPVLDMDCKFSLLVTWNIIRWALCT